MGLFRNPVVCAIDSSDTEYYGEGDTLVVGGKQKNGTNDFHRISTTVPVTGGIKFDIGMVMRKPMDSDTDAIRSLIDSSSACVHAWLYLLNGSAVQWLEWGNGTGPRSNMVAYNLTSITFINETHTSSYFEIVGYAYTLGGSNPAYPVVFGFGGWIVGHIAGNLRPSGLRINVNAAANSTSGFLMTYMQQDLSQYNSLYQPENGTFYLSPYRLFYTGYNPINVSRTMPPYGNWGNISLNYYPALQNEPLFSSSYYNFVTPLSIFSGMNMHAYYSNGGMPYSVNNTLRFNAFLLGMGKIVECSITFKIVSGNVLGNQ